MRYPCLEDYENDAESVVPHVRHRDGVREPSVVGRMTTADRPEPSVSPGLVPNQWFVAWNDFEGGHPEAFVARVDCK